MKVLRAGAEVNTRSIAGQAEHWMPIGRAVERDPTIAYSRIELALRGLRPLDLDTLSEAEQDDFLDRMADDELKGVPSMEAFFADRRRRGVGVGLDENDNIIEQQPDPRA